jgi:sugar transferase (PEP-CTERM/EpsH1 system associated)
VAHRVPYPPDKGDRIRTYHILRHLSSWADVHLACLADEPTRQEARALLGRLCARVEVAPVGRWSRWWWALGSLASGASLSEGAFYSPALVRVLRSWAQETRFHAALASASSVAPYLRLAELAEVPAVVDLVDVDSQKWLDYAAASRGLRSWLYRLEGRRLRRQERAVAGWAHAVTLVSAHEADLYRQLALGSEVHAVTNGVDFEYFQPRQEDPPQEACVFVGSLDYYPNVDGACWFAREVWPAVHARRPEARLRLVGRKPVAEVRRLGELPGIDVVGQVPDVRPFLGDGTVAVAPLRIARGLQNKVLEAMAMARPVVASPQALAGLGQCADLPALRADTPSQWIESLCELLGDPLRCRQLGQAGRRYVEQHHDWERCLEPFFPLLNSHSPSSTPRAAAGCFAASRAKA